MQRSDGSHARGTRGEDEGRGSAERADRPVHLFTVDVEEYFQVAAFEPTISRADWSALPARVHRATDQLLELLAGHGVEATFFCLGWIADRHPDLVRRLAAAGHEVASHGWSHRRITELSRDEFRTEARRSKALLESLIGEPIRGFRAPNFSLVPGVEWAFDILAEEGYEYDSSVFPIRRVGYGYPGAPTRPYRVGRPAGEILELPLATLGWMGLRLPAAGGAYLRQLPYALVKRAFERADQAGESAVLYIHPWELDPDQPRLPVPLVSRIRHYGGLRRTAGRLDRLLSDFRFTSVRDRFGLGGTPVKHRGEPPRTPRTVPAKPRISGAR